MCVYYRDVILHYLVEFRYFKVNFSYKGYFNMFTCSCRFPSFQVFSRKGTYIPVIK